MVPYKVQFFLQVPAQPRYLRLVGEVRSLHVIQETLYALVVDYYGHHHVVTAQSLRQITDAQYDEWGRTHRLHLEQHHLGHYQAAIQYVFDMEQRLLD